MESIKPCPMCNEIKNVRLTSKDVYDRLLQNYYDGISENVPCMSIKCWDCDLELYTFSSIHSYKYKSDELIKKWNNMPRRENTNGE